MERPGTCPGAQPWPRSGHTSSPGAGKGKSASRGWVSSCPSTPTCASRRTLKAREVREPALRGAKAPRPRPGETCAAPKWAGGTSGGGSRVRPPPDRAITSGPAGPPRAVGDVRLSPAAAAAGRRREVETPGGGSGGAADWVEGSGGLSVLPVAE
ncbi:Hypothetical predicted protein [Marmota monax]|uniref:Uncharacterized protein n=1 Tax=Marmota monax TaxID=9995 RepID=A0A5E4CFC2_MARMO|nr:Hypothetical predicted protein [Marmota monax]